MENERDCAEKALQSIKAEYMEPEMSKEQLEQLKKKIDQAKKENKKARGKIIWLKFATAAAALAVMFVILPNTSASIAYAMEKLPVIGHLVGVVTFRNYEYESERHRADIDVPELEPDRQLEDKELQSKLEKTTEEINKEIQSITSGLIDEFTKYMNDEMGYQEIVVKSEILAQTEDYFSLKLFCYQGAGSGYQWNYYYTIDLNTGERIQLKDLFEEDSDYIDRINENIKAQMKQQMEEDSMKSYWLDSDIPALDFQTITEDTSFYLNQENNLVIGFNEGDVAPMYMGAVEFEIPAEVLNDIRK